MNVGQVMQVGDEPHKTLAVIEEVLGEYALVRWQKSHHPPFLVHHSQLSKPGTKQKKPETPRANIPNGNWRASHQLGFVNDRRRKSVDIHA